MPYVTVTVPPGSEPITLTEAKAHLRVTSSDDDTYITTLIKVARRAVEAHLNRSLITQTLELRFHKSEIPSGREIRLWRPPVKTFTSLNYYDENDAANAITSFWASLNDLVAPRLYLKSGANWGSNHRALDALIAKYVAGYGAASDVPENIKQATLMLVANAYDVRSNVIMAGDALNDDEIRKLLSPHQVWGVL